MMLLGNQGVQPNAVGAAVLQARKSGIPVGFAVQLSTVENDVGVLVAEVTISAARLLEGMHARVKTDKNNGANWRGKTALDSCQHPPPDSILIKVKQDALLSLAVRVYGEPERQSKQKELYLPYFRTFTPMSLRGTSTPINIYE